MRNLTDVLGDLDRGRVVRDLNNALAQVVAAVRSTGKVGEVGIKLKIKPNGDQQVEIEDAITFKAPELTRPKTLMFINVDNSLTRTDPRQKEMELRSVGEEADEPQTLRQA